MERKHKIQVHFKSGKIFKFKANVVRLYISESSFEFTWTNSNKNCDFRASEVEFITYKKNRLW